MNNRSIAFVETQEDWYFLSRYKKDTSDELVLISTTPEVDYLAELDGLAANTVEDFCSQESLDRQGDKNIQIVEEMCSYVDRVCYDLGKALRNHKMVSFKAFFHDVKIFFDNVTCRMLPVLAAFDEIAPGAAICFRESNTQDYSGDLYDRPVLSLTPKVLSLIAHAKGCEIKWLDRQTDQGSDRRPGSFRNARSTQSNSHHSAVALAKHPIQSLFKVVSRTVDYTRFLGRKSSLLNKPVLIHSISADIGTRLFELWQAKAHGELVGFSEAFALQAWMSRYRGKARRITAQLWAILSKDLAFREHFVLNRICWFPLIESFLQRLVTRELADLFAFAPVAKQCLLPFRNAVVLTGGMIGRNWVIAQAASEIGTPFVSVHSGGFLGYAELPLHERYDMAGADYYVCGGQGAESVLGKPSSKSHWNPAQKRAKPLALGQFWLETLLEKGRGAVEQPTANSRDACSDAWSDQSKSENARISLMYVITAMVGDHRYLGYVFQQPIWYWRFLRKVVERFEHYTHVRFLLKPPLTGRYPQIRNPLFLWLEQHKPPNLEILPDMAFRDSLHLADGFIMDCPSSPLVEAVTTKKPILLYSDSSFFRLAPTAVKELAKRVTLVQSEAEFFEILPTFVSQARSHNPDLVNDDFLRQYVLRFCDGKATERAVASLRALAAKCGPGVRPTGNIGSGP